MANPPPTARRRPSTSSGSSAGGSGPQRPARRTGAAPPVRPESTPFSGPKLVVSGGPKAGEEFNLQEEEYVVGRSTDNPICIADTSVSRKHIMLRRVGQGWTVSDLGSGNGTLVNGEPINDETVLANGDVITMGDTEVTFTDVANSTMMVDITAGPSRSRPSTSGAAPGRPPPRPERVRPARAGAAKAVDPQAQRKKKIIIGSVAGVIIVAGLGLVGLKMRQKAAEEARTAVSLRKAQVRQENAAVFQDAKNHIREGRWTEAKALLLELQEKSPDMGLQDYLDRVEKEIPNQERVVAAEAALKEKRLAVAKGELDKVTPDTQMYEQVNKLKRELRDTSDSQAKAARALLDTKQLDPARQAKASMEDVLVVFPEHRDAKLLNEEATKLIAQLTFVAPPPPPPPPKDPWEASVARFVDGDLSGGVALANACVTKSNKCKGGLKDMTEFGNLYKKLEDLDAKGLARLLALDKDITGPRGPSKMAKNAGTRAANIFYKSASAAKAAGQWSRAIEYARRTLQADPGHAGASNIVNDLRSKAKEIYLQAYTLKAENPEDAIPKFKEVIAMTPPDDENHQKAKNWLEQLQR
ncbi:FHA domain-containing protein [Hyalangium rubrum]|uniref:FHA domain-containing protein n=1 Tax=Hyalangium rubrum TaxID=3103134 RepID=A0ABU5H7J5_9BACT|nr:FHA domain-containing protein [Hyalangium sp. s54d21]MDY7229442.1 FHA domain-containing protein [Hyalangium sp. s54d21]